MASATDIIEDIRKYTADIEKKLLVLRSEDISNTQDKLSAVEQVDDDFRNWVKNCSLLKEMFK